jgi:precorrin isomerase
VVEADVGKPVGIGVAQPIRQELEETKFRASQPTGDGKRGGTSPG